MKRLYVVGLLTIVVFVLAIRVPAMILHGQAVSLGESKALSGQVSQALEENDLLPAYESGFTLSSVRYFLDDTWCVATVSIKNTDSALVVLEKKQGVFVVVLGPSTSFDGSYVKNLPSDVAQYVGENGAVSWD